MSFETLVRSKLLPGHTYHIFNRGNQGYNIFFSDENFRFFLRRYHEFMSPFVDTLAYCLLPNHFHLVIQIKSAEEIFEAWDNRLIRRRNGWVKAHTVEGKTADAYVNAAHARLEAEIKANPAAASGWSVNRPIAENAEPGADAKTGYKMSGWSLVNPESYAAGLACAGDARARHVMSYRHDMSALNSTPTDLILPHTAAQLVSQRFRHFMISYTKALNNERKTYGSLFQRSFRRKLITEGEGLKRVIAYVHYNGFRHGLAKSMQDYPWTSWHELSPPEHSLIINAHKTLGLYGGEQAFRAYHQFPPLSLDPMLEDVLPKHKPAA